MTKRKGRPALGMKRLVVSVPEAMLDALDAKVAAAQTVDPIDRGAVVRACLAKCLAAELRDLAQRKPATSKP